MVTNKLEKLFRTDSSVKLSLLVLLADGLFSLSSEYGCKVFGDVTNGEARVYYSNCAVGRELFELEELKERGVNVCFISGVGGKPPEELLGEASRYALELLLSELKHFVYITSQSGIEYSLLAMREGDVYLAEGGVGRVSLPYVSGVIFEAHTHPASCVPSERDSTTAMVRFMEGLYASAVVGLNCVVLVYRISPITEEDLVTIKRLPEILRNLDMKTDSIDIDLGRIRILVLTY